MTAPQNLHVRVDRAPEPGLLRPAIAAVLAGRPWPTGPEAAIARAVAEAAQDSTAAARTAPISADAPRFRNGATPC